MKTNVPQLLTYYTPHRCVADDTQNLYLGFNEMKPLISLINKIQIETEALVRENVGDVSCLDMIVGTRDIVELESKLCEMIKRDVLVKMGVDCNEV